MATIDSSKAIRRLHEPYARRKRDAALVVDEIKPKDNDIWGKYGNPKTQTENDLPEHLSLYSSSKDELVKYTMAAAQINDYDKASTLMGALSDYTGNAYSKIRAAQINNAPDTDPFKLTADRCEELIKASPKYKGTTYRGVNIPMETLAKYMSKGAINGQGGALSSWSRDMTRAESFSNGGSGKRVVFICQSGQPMGTSVKHNINLNSLQVKNAPPRKPGVC